MSTEKLPAHHAGVERTVNGGWYWGCSCAPRQIHDVDSRAIAVEQATAHAGRGNVTVVD